MLFNSYTFLFLFLPISLIVYLILERQSLQRAKIIWLVIVSLFFYSFWRWQHLPLLLFSIFFNYSLGRALIRRANKGLLLLGVAANLGLLAYYKYAGLLTGTADAIAYNLTGTHVPILNIILPIGISFFTFQQIAFLVDTYKGDKVGENFVSYCLFVSFFPQLIAGPIVHHSEMLPQFEGARKKAVSVDMSIGLSILAFGLFKKIVLADNIAIFASKVFNTADAGTAIGFADAWLGTAAYTFQIYFDFSGYSDMAIGLARMFGVILPENFNSPYKSKSITEFWRRWHITLSRFLRDYLYIGLGGNRKGETRRYINLMATMLIGGLWHGAGWNFMIWGGIHGGLLVLHQLYSKFAKTYIRFHPVVATGLTLLVVAIAWVPFRATTLDGALSILGGMFGAQGFALATDIIPRSDVLPWIFGLGLIALFAPNTQEVHERFEPVLTEAKRIPRAFSITQKLVWSPNAVWALVTIVAFGIVLHQLSTVSEFIYFQF